MPPTRLQPTAFPFPPLCTTSFPTFGPSLPTSQSGQHGGARLLTATPPSWAPSTPVALAWAASGLTQLVSCPRSYGVIPSRPLSPRPLPPSPTPPAPSPTPILNNWGLSVIPTYSPTPTTSGNVPLPHYPTTRLLFPAPYAALPLSMPPPLTFAAWPPYTNVSSATANKSLTFRAPSTSWRTPFPVAGTSLTLPSFPFSILFTRRPYSGLLVPFAPPWPPRRSQLY